MKKLLGLGLVISLLVVGMVTFADTNETTESYSYGRQGDGRYHMTGVEMTEEERAEHLQAKVQFLDQLLADGKITQDQYDTFKTATEACTGDPSACSNDLRLRDVLEEGQGFRSGQKSGHRQGRRHQ